MKRSVDDESVGLYSELRPSVCDSRQLNFRPVSVELSESSVADACCTCYKLSALFLFIDVVKLRSPGTAAAAAAAADSGRLNLRSTCVRSTKDGVHGTEN